VKAAVVLFIGLNLISCSPVDAFKSLTSESLSAHERYGNSLRKAGLDSTALGREWLAASDSALRSPLVADPPFREIGHYQRTEARAVAHRVALRGGQRLLASLRAEGLPARIYLDLFAITPDTGKPFKRVATANEVSAADSAAAELSLEYEASEDGDYILRLQAELLRSGRYELSIVVEPALMFPVAGGDNSSIRSGFGAERDAGVRSHAGIDIFAPRGTPVLAATGGRITSVTPNNLGGNVVWLHDSSRDQSLYYAHLEQHAVHSGEQVQSGDTIGFVGNTGNARTTPPHLHFGIYRRGSGAIDPAPFVRRSEQTPPRIRADTAWLGLPVKVRANGVSLRQGPDARHDADVQLARNSIVHLMGASAGWFRVQLPGGESGYLPSNAVRLDRT
jgi:murein DD-endopeptidase MepM/ murein hydrolase activator NlpD